MAAEKPAVPIVTYLGVLARAVAYGVRAAATRRAVERLQSRYRDRADSARYMSEAMTVLDVDEPTTSAYMEVATLSDAMAANIAGIISASDSLSTVARGLESETKAQHGRMADANRTHTVPMANREFIKPK